MLVVIIFAVVCGDNTITGGLSTVAWMCKKLEAFSFDSFLLQIDLVFITLL